MNVQVAVRNGDVARAIRQLKKKCEREGVLADVRRRAGYPKPSVKRRIKHTRVMKRASSSGIMKWLPLWM